MSRLFLMCGIAFSGKSTLARRMARRLDAIVISLDEINDARGLGLEGGSIPDSEWVKTHEMASGALVEAMKRGRDIILDDTHCFRWLRDKYRALAGSHGFQAIVVYMDVDVGTAMSRLVSNSSEKSRRGLPYGYFLAHVERFEKPDPDEDCLVHKVGSDADEWMNRHF